MPAAPPNTRPRIIRRKPARKKPGYTYVPFRPGAELDARLRSVAERTGTTVSELIRSCCTAQLPVMERTTPTRRAYASHHS